MLGLKREGLEFQVIQGVFLIGTIAQQEGQTKWLNLFLNLIVSLESSQLRRQGEKMTGEIYKGS